MSRYLIVILLSAWSISLRAQVAEKLQQLGMENIQTVTEVNGNTTIAFEDNVYRGTYRGIGKAIEAAMEGMHGGNLQMVVLEHSIPQLCITLTEKVITEYKEKQITIGEVYRQMGISYDTDEAMEVLKKRHRTLNSSAPLFAPPTCREEYHASGDAVAAASSATYTAAPSMLTFSSSSVRNKYSA